MQISKLNGIVLKNGYCTNNRVNYAQITQTNPQSPAVTKLPNYEQSVSFGRMLVEPPTLTKAQRELEKFLRILDPDAESISNTVRLADNKPRVILAKAFINLLLGHKYDLSQLSYVDSVVESAKTPHQAEVKAAVAEALSEIVMPNGDSIPLACVAEIARFTSNLRQALVKVALVGELVEVNDEAIKLVSVVNNKIQAELAKKLASALKDEEYPHIAVYKAKNLIKFADTREKAVLVEALLNSRSEGSKLSIEDIKSIVDSLETPEEMRSLRKFIKAKGFKKPSVLDSIETPPSYEIIIPSGHPHRTQLPKSPV
ncbi:MAG: hypothetical protein PHC64_05115 [Candidatus Gastranaerophilales bacterium]|nr:hypothetical protein [Candidatus Gastranaerophilales bacterium]